jgi:hypothetical protein
LRTHQYKTAKSLENDVFSRLFAVYTEGSFGFKIKDVILLFLEIKKAE